MHHEVPLMITMMITHLLPCCSHWGQALGAVSQRLPMRTQRSGKRSSSGHNSGHGSLVSSPRGSLVQSDALAEARAEMSRSAGTAGTAVAAAQVSLLVCYGTCELLAALAARCHLRSQLIA